jgi:molybdenum cofactor cytidylyltransferase
MRSYGELETKLMRFGPVPVEEAVGAISAHTIRAGEVVLKKGSVISGEIAAHIKQAGIQTVVAARLDPGDVGEDEAARQVAEALAGENVVVEHPFTGRSNLYAKRAGVLVVSKGIVDRINAVDEAITAATLQTYKPVIEGEMIGTAKIIPFAAPCAALDRVLAITAEGRAVTVAPYVRRKVVVVSTLLPGLKPSVVTKTLQVLTGRLDPASAAIAAEVRVTHDVEALRRILVDLTRCDADLVVVFGASAIADRGDVIPAAIERAGGHIEHFGMPVDPGNLLLIGSLGDKPVIGAPGCARSPKENGFDWVLHRLLAGLPVERADITSLGVGGLLMEIVSRPQPRARDERIKAEGPLKGGVGEHEVPDAVQVGVEEMHP